MYTITFYSFKGGVGRTMALVNVAAELVRRGRKVLVVDFDLEAPGLTTYKHLQPPKPSPGVVEYVTEFMRTNESPDVSRFVYPVDLTSVLSRHRRRKSHKPVPDTGSRELTGQLWVMPAGKGDAAYGAALAAINWNSLYENRHGYLFFEDTKLQWEKSFQPDYVLIDSRTGHSDVGGICTRQLADAVVLMFSPNKQNLLGLRDVCNAIRAEARENKRSITRHLVMSNAPRLDDEEGVLRRQKRLFLSTLGFRDLDAVIDRYDSLEHLDQRVFALERPHSRLAAQYRGLVRQLISQNEEDRNGVIVELNRLCQEEAGGGWPDPMPLREEKFGRPDRELIRPIRNMPQRITDKLPDDREPTRDRLEHIAHRFRDDQEILVLVAEIYSRTSRFLEANDLLDQSLRLGEDPEARLLRSRVRFQLGRKEQAGEDLLTAIHLPTSRERIVVEALRDLHRYNPQRLHVDVSRERLHALSPSAKVEVAELLAAPEDNFARAVALLQDAIPDAEGVFIAETTLPHQLSIYLLYRREWRKVIDLLRGRTKFLIPRYHALALIHQSLAHWGLGGEMPEYLCRQIVEVTHAPSACESHAADCQALALVYWRLGDRAQCQGIRPEGTPAD